MQTALAKTRFIAARLPLIGWMFDTSLIAYRRRAWIATHRRAIALAFFAIMLAISLSGIWQAGNEYLALLDSRNAHITEKADRLYVSTFGQPGFVHTDLEEFTQQIELNTSKLKVRK